MVERKGRAISKGTDEPVAGTRRRGAQLESAILSAAWDVLEQKGYAGFSFEAVAARAMTSRSVLYRRWPDRSDLLVATIGHAAQSSPIQVPDTGNLRDDAIGLLRNANAARASATVRVATQLADYFRETGTSFDDLRHTLVAGRASGFEVIARRAHGRGELSDLPVSPRVMNLPLDLLRHEIFTTRKPVASAVIVEIIDDIWLPLLRMTNGR